MDLPGEGSPSPAIEFDGQQWTAHFLDPMHDDTIIEVTDNDLP